MLFYKKTILLSQKATAYTKKKQNNKYNLFNYTLVVFIKPTVRQHKQPISLQSGCARLFAGCSCGGVPVLAL